MKSWLKPQYGLILFLVLSLTVRFWNYREAMYFIFDVGRDALVLREMARGDLKLIGATTGLPGIFLGPLWYYAGLPGYIISQGNPYGIQLWYILLSSLALPLYWILCQKLFPKPWSVVAAYILALIPGGFSGTNFVWNPMLSLPLMTAALLCLLKARDQVVYLYAGMFCLALTLQSEFAYAIFFVVTGYAFIPVIRKRFEPKTMLVAALVMGITLIPQLIFEVTHHFSMTQAILTNLGHSTTSVTFDYLWQIRPSQLWNASVAFFIKGERFRLLTTVLLVAAWLTAVIRIIVKGNYPWRLILFMAVMPYGFYMLWRGNYGYFFDYYITPHFIFLVLLMVYGLLTWSRFRVGAAPVLLLLGCLGYHSYIHLNGLVFNPDNRAGLQVMLQAVEQMYDWSHQDQPTQAVFRVYTPNLSSENYDYLTWWLSKTKGYTHPLTVQSNQDTYRYILYEPEEHVREARFIPWYTTATKEMTKTREQTFGVLTVETWRKGNQ